MPIQTASLRFVHSASITPGVTTVMVEVRTPHGKTAIAIDSAMWQGKEYTGVFEPTPEPKPKAISKKAQKRASMRQENEIAEALNGRRQAGSGAVAHLKGDVRVRHKYRVEAKYTRSGSYRVTRTELSKLRGECAGTELPVFVIDFVDPQTGGSADRWAMLQFEDLLKHQYEPPNATRNHR